MPVVTATIKSEGKVLPPAYQVLSIETSSEVNRIPSATLIMMDGDAAAQDFALSDETFFEPGKEIEIQLRYEGQSGTSKTVFKGLVVRHNLELGLQNSTLTVEMQDAAVKMTRGRKSGVYKEKTDSDIFKNIIGVNGLKSGAIKATQPTHDEMVQYYCSDWDFILSRAEVNQLIVVVENGEVGLKKLEITGKTKYVFEYGISEIFAFEMEADGSRQFESIETVAWDIKNQKVGPSNKAAEFSLSQSNLKPKSIAGKLGGGTQILTSTVPMDTKEGKNWADSAMALSRMSMMRGVISVTGTADIGLTDIIEIKGIGKRFNGTTMATGIRHNVNSEGWFTHVQFGLSGQSFYRQPDIMDAPAAGLLPAVQGLQVGVVDGFKEDSNDEFRVRIILPGIDAEKGGVWARLASPDAGKERGLFFRPETGDEVVVGFFNDDPRQAVILGALFGSKNSPPADWANLDAENAFKGIVSRTGFCFQMDDKEGTVTLYTPEKQSIMFDDKNKKVEIKDMNGNEFTLSDDGINMKSSKKLTIEASGDIEIKGSNIKLDASGNVEIKGSQVDVK